MSTLKEMADCYRNQYGEKTDELFLSLTKPAQKVALINPFLSEEQKRRIMGSLGQAIEALGMPFFRTHDGFEPEAIDGLLSHYILDLSSVLPALIVPIHAGHQILDMCAAPGGKLLVMMARMIEGVRFFANDLSKERSHRLRRVLQGFVPDVLLKALVTITNKDATFFGLAQQNHYDAILLDAPCSSEAHIVRNPELLKRFLGLRKSLPMRQYALLCAGLLALKPGGYLMYATCSINKNENEGVIKKLLRKKGLLYSLEEITTSPIGEKGEYGITILPHLHGAGPAFFSLIKKRL